MVKFIAFFILGNYIAYVIYLGFRIGEVYNFRMRVNKITCNYRFKKRLNFDPFWPYSSLPSYTRMVFSFKPLKLESYYSKEEIEKFIEYVE